MVESITKIRIPRFGGLSGKRIARDCLHDKESWKHGNKCFLSCSQQLINNYILMLVVFSGEALCHLIHLTVSELVRKMERFLFIGNYIHV